MIQIWMKAFYSEEFDVLTRKQITQPAAHFRLFSPIPAAVSISFTKVEVEASQRL